MNLKIKSHVSTHDYKQEYTHLYACTVIGTHIHECGHAQHTSIHAHTYTLTHAYVRAHTHTHTHTHKFLSATLQSVRMQQCQYVINCVSEWISNIHSDSHNSFIAYLQLLTICTCMAKSKPIMYVRSYPPCIPLIA